jgi:hypothetical protein
MLLFYGSYGQDNMASVMSVCGIRGPPQVGVLGVVTIAVHILAHLYMHA